MPPPRVNDKTANYKCLLYIYLNCKFTYSSDNIHPF